MANIANTVLPVGVGQDNVEFYVGIGWLNSVKLENC